jgi:drug/metabolite transporter (DMT)-like permease
MDTSGLPPCTRLGIFFTGNALMRTALRTGRQVRINPAVAGPLLMLSAAMLFTILNIIIKQLGPSFRVWDIGFYRFMGGLVVLLAIFGRGRNPFSSRNILLLIIRGCVGSAAFICLITAIRLLPVSTALVIFYSYPVFSALFAFWLYGESIGKFEVLCFLLVIFGVGVLFNFQLNGGLFGQLMALVASAFAGLTVTLIRTLRVHNGPVIIYLYFCTMGTLVTLPQFIRQPAIPATSVEWVMVLLIVFISVSAQLLMNQGFFYCRGWEGGVFMSSEVIFTSIIGIFFLGDPASWRFWTGGLMILTSVALMHRLKAARDQNESAKLLSQHSEPNDRN